MMLAFLPQGRVLGRAFSLVLDFPAQHANLYLEVRLNPNEKALILRAKCSLTHHASIWLRRDGRYYIEEATQFARDIYSLMGWDITQPYAVPEATVQGIQPDDHYFNLKQVLPLDPLHAMEAMNKLKEKSHE